MRDRPFRPLHAGQVLRKPALLAPQLRERGLRGLARPEVALPSVVGKERAPRPPMGLFVGAEGAVEGPALLSPRGEQAIDLGVHGRQPGDKRPQAAAGLHDETPDVAVGPEQRMPSGPEALVIEPEEVFETLARRGAQQTREDLVVAGRTILGEEGS